MLEREAAHLAFVTRSQIQRFADLELALVRAGQSEGGHALGRAHELRPPSVTAVAAAATVAACLTALTTGPALVAQARLCRPPSCAAAWSAFS